MRLWRMVTAGSGSASFQTPDVKSVDAERAPPHGSSAHTPRASPLGAALAAHARGALLALALGAGLRQRAVELYATGRASTPRIACDARTSTQFKTPDKSILFANLFFDLNSSSFCEFQFPPSSRKLKFKKGDCDGWTSQDDTMRASKGHARAMGENRIWALRN